jgi:hypothetical protein
LPSKINAILDFTAGWRHRDANHRRPAWRPCTRKLSALQACATRSRGPSSRPRFFLSRTLLAVVAGITGRFGMWRGVEAFRTAAWRSVMWPVTNRPGASGEPLMM